MWSGCYLRDQTDTEMLHTENRLMMWSRWNLFREENPWGGAPLNHGPQHLGCHPPFCLLVRAAQDLEGPTPFRAT